MSSSARMAFTFELNCAPEDMRFTISRTILTFEPSTKGSSMTISPFRSSTVSEVKGLNKSSPGVSVWRIIEETPPVGRDLLITDRLLNPFVLMLDMLWADARRFTIEECNPDAEIASAPNAIWSPFRSGPVYLSDRILCE